MGYHRHDSWSRRCSIQKAIWRETSKVLEYGNITDFKLVTPKVELLWYQRWLLHLATDCTSVTQSTKFVYCFKYWADCYLIKNQKRREPRLIIEVRSNTDYTVYSVNRNLITDLISDNVKLICREANDRVWTGGAVYVWLLIMVDIEVTSSFVNTLSTHALDMCL